jgi:hypothetical protein
MKCNNTSFLNILHNGNNKKLLLKSFYQDNMKNGNKHQTRASSDYVRMKRLIALQKYYN